MLHTLLRTGLRGDCPGCETQSMFRGLYEIPTRCSRCDLQYQGGRRAWLGAIAIGVRVRRGGGRSSRCRRADLGTDPGRRARSDVDDRGVRAGGDLRSGGPAGEVDLVRRCCFHYGFMRWPDGTPTDGTPRQAATRRVGLANANLMLGGGRAGAECSRRSGGSGDRRRPGQTGRSRPRSRRRVPHEWIRRCSGSASVPT